MSTEPDITPNITPLNLTDSFHTWFLATNKLIDYVNPIQLYDVVLGNGLTEDRGGGIVTINLDIGKGIKLFPTVGSGQVTINLAGIYESSETVIDSDYVLVERYDTSDNNYIFSVNAEDMLPPTLNSNHYFSGEITVSSLNVNNNVIKLQYGDAYTETDSGIILDTTSSSKVKFTYNVLKSAWLSSKNIGVSEGYSYISGNTNKDAFFRYATSGSQYDVVLELAMGVNSTHADDSSWLIEARRILKQLNFVYRNSFSTDLDRNIFSVQLDDDYGVGSTFTIADKISIGNISGSTNFKQITNYTQNIVPISTSYGILDKSWTNRYTTTNYDAGLLVGNLVNINTPSSIVLTKMLLSTTSNEAASYSIGIVEKITGGVAYVVLLGEFEFASVPSPALVVGSVYYLNNGTPNYTVTKPSVGIIKPVFIALSNKSGMLFPMGSGLLSYGKVSVSSAAESGYIIGTGLDVFSSATNGGITLVAGNGITLETDNDTKNITIRALTAGNQPGYSTIQTLTDNKILQAVTPQDTITFAGTDGIEITGTDTTNNDHVYIKGNYFRTIGITSDDTNEETDTFAATTDSQITLYGGTGIALSRYGAGSNIIRITATGDVQPVINNYTLSLLKIQKQAKNSLLFTAGTTAYEEVRALTASAGNGLFLTANTSGNISWSSPYNSFITYIANKTLLSGESEFTLNNNRFLGISTYSSSSVYKNTAFFIQNTLGADARVQLSLIEGAGIQLTVNNATNATGAPSITITNTSLNAYVFNKIHIEDSGETIIADATGILNFTTVPGSPIILDSDTNNLNLYFNIRENSIANIHLATMPDNTVKIGRGTTDPSTPEDLLINANHVLGRLSGDLQSLSRTNLLSLLQFTGSSYFNTVEADSGTTTSLDSETLTIIGGSGITVDVDTNNKIVITNTLPESGTDTGINFLGNRVYNEVSTLFNYTPGLSGITKLYFQDNTSDSTLVQSSDILVHFNNISTDPLKGAVTLSINWLKLGLFGNSVENTSVLGSGLMYGYGDSIGKHITKFAQSSVASGGINIPYFNHTVQFTGVLEYFNTYDAVSYDDILDNALLGFNRYTGLLIKTNRYVKGFEGTPDTPEGLDFVELGNSMYSLVNNYKSVTFKNFKSTFGLYSSGMSGLWIEPTIGKQFVFTTTNSNTAFSKLLYIDFASNLINNDGDYTSGMTLLTDTQISIKTFSSDWYSLSSSKICLPTMMISEGPSGSLTTASTGYLIENNSSTGSLSFTNYNFNDHASRTTAMDRSSRISLNVLDVDTSSTAYSTIKSTGSLSHSYSTTSDVVDTFTLSANTVKSIKYLIQARSTSNVIFTSEFVVQVSTYSTGSCKYIQYASISQDSGFTLDIIATLSTNTVTISHNGTALSANILITKVIKQEI